MEYDNITIPTYIINLPSRTDRRESVGKEFEGRTEFDVHFVEAETHPIGAVGLWESIKKIIKMVVAKGEDDVIIICEDDHIFTPYYDRDKFLSQVLISAELGTHILYGGVCRYGNLVPVTKELFWLDWSWWTQFIVLYRPAFEKILRAEFTEKDVADEFLSQILANKLMIYPFISKQRNFGYSDIATIHYQEDRHERLFVEACNRTETYLRIIEKYQLLP